MVAGDRQLLFLGVTRDFDHLHAIAKRRRNRIENVRRGNEQHLREIERHVKVVIAEHVVLLRIEHLQQRGGRIATEIVSELVDLVEDKDRILELRSTKTLDDLPRQRADVRSTMAANLRLVAHAAEGDANELAAKRLRNRPRERGL